MLHSASWRRGSPPPGGASQGGASPSRRRKRRQERDSPSSAGQLATLVANQSELESRLATAEREVEWWRGEAEAARAQASQAASLLERQATNDTERRLYEDELEARVEELSQRLQREAPPELQEPQGRALLASLRAGAAARLMGCFFAAAKRWAVAQSVRRWRECAREDFHIGVKDVRDAFHQAAAAALLTRIVLDFKARLLLKAVVRWCRRMACT